jgi:hypothetical protein
VPRSVRRCYTSMKMRRFPVYIFVLITFLSVLSLSLAASTSPGLSLPPKSSILNTPLAPMSFCKCTCFGNSTIVALDAPKKPAAADAKPRASKKSCSECNRQFCLSYPFCKGEKEENVLTTCFQRDSAKDQVIVYMFIGATVGLLGWAAVRPWVQRVRERGVYVPLPGQADG